jgi:hypothetical protein
MEQHQTTECLGRLPEGVELRLIEVDSVHVGPDLHAGESQFLHGEGQFCGCGCG